MPIKYVKFYYVSPHTVKTLFVAEGKFVENGQDFEFTDAGDMLRNSTEETANFWNGLYVGRGIQSA